MNTLTFGVPEWFWALIALPILALLFWRAERRGTRRIQEFVSGRLLPRLAGTVNRFRRWMKFALLLCALAFAIAALAQPRRGYTYDDTKRKGLDLILAVDTSRSMLSNDLQPNRLERVKLAAQDLVNELQGDRVGLIAFAGRAFLQAPLTIDYGAAVEAINDLDTNTIPEGGTNISEAISLAASTYGKSAVGNRALIIFTDGEELSGDAIRSAKAAADAGVRIFTVGVGTPEGSLIPISGENGGTAFVKDSNGQVVKSKLDETRLREIAEATGGIYLRLGNGPGTMKQLITQGLLKMKAGEIDARLARRPIERYEWPLGAALVALVASILISDRKRARAKVSSVAAISDRRIAANHGDGQRPPLQPSRVVVAVGIFFVAASAAHGSAPGLDSYRQEKFQDAYQEFQETLKEHPRTKASDKIQFDSGAAAYKMKDYNKALESFSQALLSRDTGLQSNSHYNLGNTLYQRGDGQKADDKKLTDWTNALQHYDETLKLDPQNKEAKENREFVQRKIDELKKKREQQPTPTPSPSPKSDKNEKKQDKQDEQQKDQQKQSSDQNQKQDQKDQQKENQGSGDQQKPENKKENQEGKNESKDSGKNREEQSKPGESPSPSPGESPSPSPGETPSSSSGESPSPSPPERSGENSDQTKEQSSPGESPSSSDRAGSSPTPSPGEGSGAGAGESPAPSPAESPSKKPSGEVKGANGESPQESPEPAAQAEEGKEGEMSEKQAERLLQSMKDEEQRVQLDERKAVRPVYKDW